MKTKTLVLATILTVFGASVSFAANDNNTDAKNPKEYNLKQNKDGKKCDRAFNPFEGLNLTADQQAKLEALRPQGKCDGSGKQNCDKKRDNCPLNGDAKVDRRQAKRDYLAKVKAILTPEQYVTFLENMAVSGHDKAPGKYKKDNRRHQHADCPNRK